MFRVVRYKVLLFLLAIICCVPVARAQQFDIVGHKKRVNIPFKIVRSMAIIKLYINNRGPYNFILDTGVGLMLITDPTLADSLNIENTRTIKIAGLGERDDYEALVAPVLNINIGDELISRNVSAAILKKDFFGLSNYAGMPIHGLLGYEFFNKLAVKVSFTDSILTVTRPGGIRIFRRAEKIPLTIEESKPYITAKVTLPNGTETLQKLLLDLGAGHALSLEKIDSLPQKSIKANLGIGLNGLIDGHLGRITRINIGKYKIDNIITSFPANNPSAKTSIFRNGSIGIGILKRFDIIFDYQNSMMYVKPNFNISQSFEHDMTGLSYHAAGKNLDHLVIEKVDEGSPAEELGILENDEIISINFKPVSQMSLQQIDELFKSRNDRSILLELYRDKITGRVLLTLKRRI